jgi:hypothetical protein
MADDIKWNIIGRDELFGRAAIIEKCSESTKFLETVTGSLTRLDTHLAGERVIVEGAAQFRDQDDKLSRVASCDIFRFSEERLVEITSYVIDLRQD